LLLRAHFRLLTMQDSSSEKEEVKEEQYPEAEEVETSEDGSLDKLKEEKAPEAEEEELNEDEYRNKILGSVGNVWEKAAPIAIRGLSVPKDSVKEDAKDELPGAPNFVTAILGTWIAGKLKCASPRPEANEHQDDSEHKKRNYVISNVSLVLSPGETTLIIAPSSSGKSTLMGSISNLCQGIPQNKEGTLLVGGCDPADPKYEGCFRRLTAFADQGDLTLTPVLTVKETVEFTSSCAEEPRGGEEDNIEPYLRLAGLDHVAGTVVGNAEIRGVSGGQKRRVKVLEQAVGQDVRVLLLDEITNGLDSASALATCKNFVVAAQKTGITILVSLLQPSIDMYEQFPRILVLNQFGEMVYSGPREKALEHFQADLGLTKPKEMDEPEFLLRCAFRPQDFEEEEGAGKDEERDSSMVASTFGDTPAGKALSRELDVAESTRAKKEPSVVRPFARSTWTQLVLLCGRGKKLKLRNPGNVFRVAFAIIFGFFVGTLFLNTPDDAAGTQTRAGYAFTMLLLLFTVAANSPMEANFNDRGTFYCHRQSNFYSTRAYYISTMLWEFPVTFLEATLMSVCSFFLVGMESYGGAGFLYFWLMALSLSLCGSSLSRVLSYGLPSNDVAATLGPAFLMVFNLTAGFAPQYPAIPGWLRWLSWLSPCAYGFEGILINEVYTRDVGGIPGSVFGQNAFSLPRIPYDEASAGMKTPISVMFFDIYVIAALTIIFEVIGCVLLHKSQAWYGPSTKRYQVTSGMSLTASNADVTKKIFSFLSKDKGKTYDDEKEEKKKSSVPSAPPAHLTARDIVYEVDVAISPDDNDKKKAKDEGEKAVSEEPKEELGGGSATARSASFESDERVPITAREYGQARKGAAQEWVLRRTLGVEALSTRSFPASDSKSIRVEDEIAAAEAGVAQDLEPPEPGRLRLLSGVTATFSPGSMTALMGSSGAGKTTLLDVLAGYKTGGHITGDIAINGVAKTDETWRLIAGYCEQTDLHNPAMTVRESLLFAARMRLRPFSLSEEARTAYCEENMRLLELEEFADILVGDEAAGEGLPKHARKRLTLGVELVANPSILFADEPTSGLASLSAALVVSSLKRAANSRGVTVVCTIHQPSREVFETFDNLLLLRKGGVCVYNGPIPKISNYMTSVSGNDAFALKDGTNPADHALDIFCGPGGESEDWGKLYKQSSMASQVRETVNNCSSESGGVEVKAESRSTFSELRSVLQRQVLGHWRTPTYMAVRFWWTLSASLLTSFIFMNIDDTGEGAFDLVGAVFNFVNLAQVPLLSASVPLITERAVYYREISSGTYRKYTYAMAVEIAELPFNFFMAIVSWLIFYWIVGLDRDADRVGYNLLMTLAVYWVLPLFGQLFSFISPNIGIASVIGGLLLVAFTLTMGFLISPDNIPPWWIWLYWINPLRYVLQGLAVNELGGGKEYFLELTGEMVSGDVLLDNIGGWSFDQRWWYCYVVVLLFGFAASAGLLFATRINWMNR